MCLTCGCGRPYAAHGNPRNITYPVLRMAAAAAGITDEQAAQNLARTLAQVTESDPAAAFLAAFRPLTVGIDIDGVLAFFSEAAATALNARFDATYTPDSFISYRFEEWLPAEQAAWVNALFAEPGFYASLAPDYGAIAAVQAIAGAGIPVVIASDRPPAALEVTSQWLTKWRVPFGELRMDGPGTKQTLAAQHSPQRPLLFVDDDPEKIAEIPRPGVRLMMPRRTYTPADVPDGVTVFDTWVTVLDTLRVPRPALVPQLTEAPTA